MLLRCRQLYSTQLMRIPQPNQSDLLNRYQRLLDIEPGAPSLEDLRRLVRSQIQRVPFENVSKLWRFQRKGLCSMVSLEDHLDGIEHHRFGGTCYANNWHFGQLLRHLGYEVGFCGADMSQPDVHTVLIVVLDGREFLVDVGYGAPFYEPVPRDLESSIEIAWGRCKYVFHPLDPMGRTRLEMYRSGQLIHGYLAKNEPRSIDYFTNIVRDSFRPDTHFMTALVAERFFPDRSVRIHNYTINLASPTSHAQTQLDDRDQVARAVEEHCGIEAAIVREAIAGISIESDIYSE